MRKILSILLAVVLATALFGCSKKTETETPTQLPNPIKESTAKEILETLGISFHIPEDAKNISYSTIQVSEGKAIAQANFSINNVEYTHRIQPRPAFEDISGAYYEWKTVKKIEVSYCMGELRYNTGKEGVCLWYDTVPGLMYSLYTEKEAGEESLLTLANLLFVPAKDVP